MQEMIDPNNWQIPSHTVSEFTQKNTKYVLLIPVLNEGERIRTQLLRMKELSARIDIVIVDGGSTDGALEESYLKNSGVRSLIIKTGPGKLSAQLRIGLAYAMIQGYAGVVLIDGNNKDNPNAVPQFIAALDEGYDHVQGSRFIPGGVAVNTPLSRLLGIKLLHAPLISFAAGVRYTDTTNGFRAYSKKLLLDDEVQPFRDIFSRYELHYYLAIRAGKLGMKVKELPVERAYPQGKIPTKISSFRGNLLVLKTLFAACLGIYNPSS